MSTPQDPGYRPGQWETAGDHERRIRALEAVAPQNGSIAYAFRQINVYTLAAGASGFQVPDVDWSVAFGPNPLNITFASGVWTISEPGIYIASAGCRFQNSAPVTTPGVVNFSLFVPAGNIMDTQTSVPVTAGIFVANPANSMMWDTGTDLTFNEVHHEFSNATDATVDVGYVNVNIWWIAASAS